MELFVNNASGVYGLTGDPFEMERRAACYDAHQLKVHASWEIRFWYAARTEFIPYANAEVSFAGAV